MRTVINGVAVRMISRDCAEIVAGGFIGTINTHDLGIINDGDVRNWITKQMNAMK